MCEQYIVYIEGIRRSHCLSLSRSLSIYLDGGPNSVSISELCLKLLTADEQNRSVARGFYCIDGE